MKAPFDVCRLSFVIRLLLRLFNYKPQTTNHKLLHCLLPVAYCLLANSCANIVAPSGGPKDETPPKVAEATPPNESTRFTGNKITIEFNEFIQLTNPAQEIIISPAIKPEPKIYTRAKKIVIDFKKAVLDSNTTYIINFGDAVKDFNESNPLPGFSYVFSTGDELDSIAFSGKVMLAKDDLPAEKVLVMLYKQLDDSTVMLNKPYYFDRTNERGEFDFHHIKNGTYRLFALKDENYNFLYDLPNEQIAFIDTNFVVHDSIGEIRLKMFLEDRKGTLQRLSYDESRKGALQLLYSLPVDSIAVKSPHDSLPVGMIDINEGNDSIIVWYTRALPADSLVIVVNDTMKETLTLRNIPENLDSLKASLGKPALLLTKDRLINPDGVVRLNFNHPMVKADLEKLIIEQDSPALAIAVDTIVLSRMSIELGFNRQPGADYTITFPAGMLMDHLGQVNDTIIWKGRVRTAEDYGSLKLTVTGSPEQHYLLQLLDRNGAAIGEQSAFSGSTTLDYKKLRPGSYDVKIIYDSNNNGKWDTGNYLQRIQPERTYRHPEKIGIHANWEVEVELKLAGGVSDF